MTHVPLEFSRRVSVNRIGAAGLEQAIEASGDECRALAIRLQLPAIASLRCTFRLEAAPQGRIEAEGDLRAEVTQVCVISLEPFEATVRERFAVRFVPYDSRAARRDEDEIDPDEPDELYFSGEMIDLGETAAEQLGLALDAYPRMPGVERPAEVIDESQAPAHAQAGERAAAAADGKPDARHPFAALARLRGGAGGGNA